MTIKLTTKLLIAICLAIFLFSPLPAKAHEADDDDGGLIALEFVQHGFDGGGKIKVRFWGRDLNGDGVLYSMSGFLANNLPLFDPASNGAPLPVGNEFIRVEITFIDFFGIPRFKQVFDERETPIDLTPAFSPTAFFGFVYNLDGGKLGDDPNEGFSFAPLAPSVSYSMGELFKNLLFEPAPKLMTCGQGGQTVCAAVQQFALGDFAPIVVNEAFSNKRIKVRKMKKEHKMEDDREQCEDD